MTPEDSIRKLADAIVQQGVVAASGSVLQGGGYESPEYRILRLLETLNCHLTGQAADVSNVRHWQMHLDALRAIGGHESRTGSVTLYLTGGGSRIIIWIEDGKCTRVKPSYNSHETVKRVWCALNHTTYPEGAAY